MSMYVDRPPIGDAGSRTLEQGDLLKDLPVPALPGAQSFGFRQGNKWVHKLTATQIGKFQVTSATILFQQQLFQISKMRLTG